MLVKNINDQIKIPPTTRGGGVLHYTEGIEFLKVT